MIISVQAGKVFSKTQYSSVIENYEKKSRKLISQHNKGYV